MLSVLDLFFSLICTVLPLLLLGISIWRRCVLRYSSVNCYAAVLLLCDGVRYVALWRYGFSSPQYFYAYFITDALLVAATFLVIISFYEVIFGRTSLGTSVRWALAFFVVLTAAVSYVMIARNVPHFYSRFMVEFLQNMYFAAVILTVLVWISVNYLRVEDPQVRMLIAGLGLSLSVQAATYAFQALLPKETFVQLQSRGVLTHISALATVVKLGLWCMAVSGYRLANRKLVPLEAVARGGA